MEAVAKDKRRVAYTLVLTFVILALGIIIGGAFYYRSYELQFRMGVEHQLSAIAELKVEELVEYRKERLGDAVIFFKNTVFSGVVRRFLDHPEDTEAQRQIQGWAAKCLGIDQYDLVRLVDVQGVTRMSIPDGGAPLSSAVIQRIPEVLRAGQVTFQDFHRNEYDKRVYLDILVPIYDGQDAGRPLGIFYLRIDPDKYLYPFIQRWPVPSKTAETLLVRRDGDDALFLNELKFRTNSVLNLRISLSKTNVPAVKAVLGQEGIVEGLDYRNVPVIAYVCAVPHSPWFMVARMDTAEMYAPLRERQWMIILLISLLILCVAAGSAAIWRHQHARLYKEQYELTEALRHERALMGTLMDNLPGAVYFKDKASRFIRLNLTTARKSGLSDPAQMIGKTDKDFFTGEHADKALADEQEIIRTGKPLVGIEEKETWPDGSETWALTTKLPLRDGKGRIIGTCGISSDITQRKRTEEALANERTFLRTLVDHLPMAIYLKDLAGRKILANRKELEFLGAASEAEVLGKTDFDRFPPETAARFRAVDEEIMRTGKPLINNESNFTKPDGAVINVIGSVVPVRDTAGRVTGLLGFTLDITARKKAEEALANERAILRTLVDHLPAAIYLKDLAGRKTLANRVELDYVGVASEAEVLGKTDFDFFPTEQAERYRAYDLEVIRSGQPVINREGVFTKPDGSVIYLLGSTVPLRDAAGRVIGLAGINYDVTDRKRAEERLLKVITQTRCILYSGHVTGPEGWRKRALGPVSPFQWDTPVLNEQTAQKIIPLDLRPGEQYLQAFARSWYHEDAVQMNWNSGNTFLNDLPFYRNEYRCTDKHGVRHWMQEFVTVQKLAENRWQIFSIAMDISDLKRIETELRESQALYHSLVDQMPAGVFRKDAQGRFILVNSVFCRLKEMTSEQFLGKTVKEVGLPDAELAVKSADHHTQIMQTGKIIEDDEVYISESGETRNYHAVKSPVFDSAGKVVGSQGVLFDITDRKRAEAALEKSRLELAELNEMLQTVLDTIPARIFWKNRDLIYLGCNRLFAKDAGRESSEDIVGEADSSLAWREQAESYRKDDMEVMRSGNSKLGYEEPQTAPDGKKRWLRTSKVPLRNVNNHVVGILGTYEDITGQKLAEEALHLSEAQLSVILESTNDGILAVDSKGEKIIKTNKRFTEMWRVPQSLIEKGDNRALVDFARRQLTEPDAFLERVKLLYGTNEVAMDTLVFKDGRVFERHGFPMLMEGKVAGRVWSFRDITERKHQEKELSDKNSELERFTYTVSHDLKSPLVTVKTFLGYLEQDLVQANQERVKQDVAYMHTAADKMSLLLDELLNLARVGRKMNPPERVTFKELAQEVVRLVAGRISTGGAEVQVADAPVVLEGDRPRLMEVWQNLVENACKFMGDQPKPRVEIGVERQGSDVVFFVRDNGMGIDPRYQEKVFGLFEKLDPKREGTGMGLALVKRIVELYEGRIWVESPGLGQGAKFLFTLPRAVIIESEQAP